MRSPAYPLVQVLRAAAALSVVIGHVAADALGFAPDAPALRGLRAVIPWDAGVDVFFVISGFVITIAAAPLFGRPDGPGRFLARRLARVAPLYWLATTAFLAAWLAVPGSIHETIASPALVLASYAFIPWPRPDGVIQPVLGVGWTLNFEMFFYALFAACIVWRRALAVGMVCAALVALVGLGQAGVRGGPVLQTWSDPIVLEFCGGIGLAMLADRARLSKAARLGLLAAGLLGLHVQAPWPRPLAIGLPALALAAAAALGGRRPLASRAAPLLLLLGDASYALYLVHPFAMRATELVWRKLGATTEPVAYTILTVGLAQLAAIGVHLGVERPLSRILRRLMSQNPQRMSFNR